MRTFCASLWNIGVTSNGELTVADTSPPPPPVWMQFCNSGISEMMVFLLFYLWPGSSPSVYDPPVGGLRLFFTQVLSPLLVCFCSSWLHHIDQWGFYTQGSSLVNMGLIQWRYNSNCRQSLKYHPVWIQSLTSKFSSPSFPKINTITLCSAKNNLSKTSLSVELIKHV